MDFKIKYRNKPINMEGKRENECFENKTKTLTRQEMKAITE